ncbi:MAG TPA: hypothetical protein VHO03_05705 [Ignavibacteriales bacterium]|nr:hypothetical protein [Ignavibacteriales bacterium]
MADGQAVSLYDFLYKDLSKISSYYAQVFSGHLTKIEKTSSSDESLAKNTGGDLKVLKYEQTLKEGLSEQTKNVFDPHDLTTTDVLSFLMENGFVSKDPMQAGNGDLVLIEGSLLMMDKMILDLSVSSIESMLAFAGQGQKSKDIKNLKSFTTIMKNFIQKMPIDATYLLKSDGSYYAGTIKEQYMDDPVSSYYLKYGSKGITDVFLIGFKNFSDEYFEVEENSLFGYGQKNIDAIKNLIIPQSAISITPIAIFRKVKPINMTDIEEKQKGAE